MLPNRLAYILFCLFSFVSVLFFTHNLNGQIKNKGVCEIENYSIEEYSPQNHRASPQNWRIFQDSSGKMFFGNSDGLLIYDGSKWRLKFLPNRSVLRSVNADTDNQIYIGGEGDFGKLLIDSAGKYYYRTLKNKVPENVEDIRNIWDIKVINDTIYIRARNKLFLYADTTIIEVFKTKGQFFFDFIINENYYVFDSEKGVLKHENGELQLIPDGDHYKYYSARAVFPFKDSLMLFASPIDGLSIYNGEKFRSWDIPASDFIVEHPLYCGEKLPGGYYALGTQGGGIIVINEQGEVKQIYNKSNGLQNNVVLDLMLDKQKNLWAALTNGISYLKINSPFSYYTENYNIPKQNYYVQKYRDNLFFSSDEGIFIKPWEEINEDLKINKARFLKKSQGQSWLFEKSGKFLLCGHNNGVIVIRNEEVDKIIPIPYNVWEMIKDPVDKNLLYACSIKGLYKLRNTGNDIILEGKIAGLDDNIMYAAIDKNGDFWISDELNGVKKMILNETKDSVVEIQEFTKEEGLPSNEGNWILNLEDEIVFTNPTHKGIYHYNNLIGRIEPYDKLNNRFNINGPVTLLRKGTEGRYWVRDDGFLKVFTENNGEYSLQKKQFNKFQGRNLERISFIDKENVMFGTDEYILNYNPHYPKDYKLDYKSHIRKVVSIQEDSVLFFGNKNIINPNLDLEDSFSRITLPYKSNALRFEYSATYYDEPGEIEYNVWLEGYENKSNKWSKETNVEYTNLREGDYSFHVIARNIYDETSEESIFHFSIDPPWYRTTLAYLVYIILFILILYTGVIIYVRKLKADRDRLERIVIERTSEIQQQKEEIKTQAEQLEDINKELQKLSLVASKTDNAVIITNERGKIEWINEGFQRLFGYNLEQIKYYFASNIRSLYKDTDIQNILNDSAKNQRSFIFDTAIEDQDGNRINVQTTLTPIVENNVLTKFIAILTDIRKIKETEEELQKLIKTKDKFFTIIAHDLKNPFQSLLGISELLADRDNSLSPDKINELHNELGKVTRQGYELLVNLLDWARSQTGRLKFKPQKINFSELVSENIEFIENSAAKKNIQLENYLKEELFVIADKNTINTVIRNLLQNAVKYSNKHGTVKVYSEPAINNDYINICVEDNGIGISPEHIDKLFRIDENYSTLGTNEEKGTGLGLILCKEFVEKNGGSINVDSVYEQGTTIRFSLKKA